jgi:hypothetical protein
VIALLVGNGRERVLGADDIAGKNQLRRFQNNRVHAMSFLMNSRA